MSKRKQTNWNLSRSNQKLVLNNYHHQNWMNVSKNHTDVIGFGHICVSYNKFWKMKAFEWYQFIFYNFERTKCTDDPGVNVMCWRLCGNENGNTCLHITPASLNVFNYVCTAGVMSPSFVQTFPVFLENIFLSESATIPMTWKLVF